MASAPVIADKVRLGQGDAAGWMGLAGVREKAGGGRVGGGDRAGPLSGLHRSLFYSYYFLFSSVLGTPLNLKTPDGLRKACSNPCVLIPCVFREILRKSFPASWHYAGECSTLSNAMNGQTGIYYTKKGGDGC